METRKEEMYRKLPLCAKDYLRSIMEQDNVTQYEVSEVYVVDEMKWLLNHYKEDATYSYHDDEMKKSIQEYIVEINMWLKQYDTEN